MATQRQLRVITILLTALLFVSVGWIAPAMYSSVAPESQFVEVNEFSAQNATVDTERHYICFDRTIHSSTTGDIFIELMLESEDGTEYEIHAEQNEKFFDDGHAVVVTPIELPESIVEGEYKYLLTVNLHLTNGRVERQFQYESNVFTIGNTTDNMTTFQNRCG